MKYKSESFAMLYKRLLSHVYFDYDNITAPRGLAIKECTNVLFELTNPLNNLFQNIARPYPNKYLAGELYWYLNGRNDLAFIEQYSKFWQGIANPDGTIDSAYGYLLFKQKSSTEKPPHTSEWTWAYLRLRDDKATRQAVIHFNKPIHMNVMTRDFPCTLTGTFQIRQDKLNLTVVMRSQDLIKGLTFDLPFFTVLQQMMRHNLLSTYPDLQLGTLTMFVESLHLYKVDYGLAARMTLGSFIPDNLPPLEELVVDWRGNCCADLRFKTTPDPFMSWVRKWIQLK